MTKPGDVTWLILISTQGIHCLSQLSRLTLPGMAFFQAGVSALLKLERLSVRATGPRLDSPDLHKQRKLATVRSLAVPANLRSWAAVLSGCSKSQA